MEQRVGIISKGPVGIREAWGAVLRVFLQWLLYISPELASLGKPITEVDVAQWGLWVHFPLALNVLLDNRDPFWGDCSCPKFCLS